MWDGGRDKVEYNTNRHVHPLTPLILTEGCLTVDETSEIQDLETSIHLPHSPLRSGVQHIETLIHSFHSLTDPSQSFDAMGATQAKLI